MQTSQHDTLDSTDSMRTAARPSGVGPSLLTRNRFTELCLRYLLFLRVFTIGGPILAIVIAYRILALHAPVGSLATISLSLAVFTCISWHSLHGSRPISNEALFVQLLIDVLGLTCLLYFIGGTDNPFSSLLLLPIMLSTVMLERRFIWLITLEAATAYTVLMLTPMPAPHWAYDQRHLQFHQLGHWCGFLLSAGIIAYFIVRMGETLRSHERALAQAREDTMTANQVLALGSLAAGTAHELGTPLATVAILAKEVQNEVQDHPDLTQQLTLLRTQVDRCKNILARMAAQAGEAQADAGRALPLERYLNNVIEEWQSLHPDCPLAAQLIHDRTLNPVILADRTVSQALLNIMNNAADAATTGVRLLARWDGRQLALEIEDDGSGFAPEVSPHIGTPFLTTKAPGHGLGLGIYLARTTIERMGGHLEFHSAVAHGTCAKINLPLGPLLA